MGNRRAEPIPSPGACHPALPRENGAAGNGFLLCWTKCWSYVGSYKHVRLTRLAPCFTNEDAEAQRQMCTQMAEQVGVMLPTDPHPGPRTVLPGHHAPVFPNPPGAPSRLPLGCFMSGLCPASCSLASTSVAAVMGHSHMMRNCLNRLQAGADQGPARKKGAPRWSVWCVTPLIGG